MSLFPIERKTNHIRDDLLGFWGDLANLGRFSTEAGVGSSDDFVHSIYYSILEQGWGVEFNVKVLERSKGFKQSFTRSGFKDNLPSIAFRGAFVEGGHGWGNGNSGDFGEGGRRGGDFFQGSFFGFVSNVETSKISIRRQFPGVAFFEEVVGECGIVGRDGGFDDGMVGLESLDDDFGFVEMATTDAADDLSEELESAFFGGKIGEGKTAVGLDDANGGEVGEVEATGKSLSADKNVDFARFDFRIEAGEVLVFFIIAIEASDDSFREEVFQLGFEKFSPETFVDDVGIATFGAGRGNFGLMPTDMTRENIAVSMKNHGKITVWAKGLPTAFFANSER